jgi:hypothetical protein
MSRGSSAAAFFLSLAIAPCQAEILEKPPICKYSDYTPAPPKGAFTRATSDYKKAADAELKRNQIIEINAGRKPLPFRITAFNESYPIRVLYKDNNTFIDGPLIFPGASADVEKGEVYLEYYCGLDASYKCANKPPQAIIGRCSDGTTKTVFNFWIAGWYALLIRNPVFEDGAATWSPYVEYEFPPASSRATIIDRDTPATYFIDAPDQPVRLILDGSNIPGGIPQHGRYYAGKRFEVEPSSLFPNSGQRVTSRFVSANVDSDGTAEFQIEDNP